MTVDEVRLLMKERMNGNAKAWCKEHDVAASYISDVMTGRREPGAKILDALGLVKVVSYEAV